MFIVCIPQHRFSNYCVQSITYPFSLSLLIVGHEFERLYQRPHLALQLILANTLFLQLVMFLQLVQSAPHELQCNPTGQSLPQRLHLQPLGQLEHTIYEIVALGQHPLHQLSITLFHHELQTLVCLHRH